LVDLVDCIHRYFDLVYSGIAMIRI
jgi:hypothetical protein